MSKILVTGDIVLDKLKWSVKKKSGANRNNWELYDGYDSVKRWGGALLLADMIRKSTKENNSIVSGKIESVESYDKEKLKNDNNQVEHFIEATSYLEERDNRIVMKKFLGHNAPGNENALKIPQTNSDDNDILVIHDAGNLFRSKKSIWPNLDGYKTIILKMSRPLAKGLLWDKIINKDELIVVVNVDDLRERGLRISRGLSWERTVEDFLKELNKIKTEGKYQDISDILKCKNLIIIFGIDGAIHYQNTGHKEKYNLYHDPEVFEGSHKLELSGSVQGIGSAFVTGLVSEISKKDLSINKKIEFGIKKGITFSRNLVKCGYIYDSKEDKMSFPLEDMFNISVEDMAKIRKIEIFDEDKKKILERRLGFRWKILEQTLDSDKKIYDMARKIVLYNKKRSLKSSVATFRQLKTADRSEIESYHTIKNLIKEYIINTNLNKPLSIAVFGPPGSGKSFGVNEIANSISDDVKRKKFNLSQFKSPKDLINAFHIVQSTALQGKIPLVFFDEFDCELDNKPYGWLKYFLGPMNDGHFKQGETDHPIGKCIFVFAGGTSHSVEEFNPGEEVKGSDFKSRLRGYVNIVGINKYKAVDSQKNKDENITEFKYIDDNVYMIRRAMALRIMLEELAGNIFEKDSKSNKANIDESVLKALIKVNKYKNDIRSMKAIVEMSILSNMTKYERTALPPSEQTRQYVDDIENFKEYLNEPI